MRFRGLVWIHPEFGNGIAPYGEDLFVKRGCNVHEAGIVGNDLLSHFNQESRLIQGKFPAAVKNMISCSSGDLFAALMIIGSAKQHYGAVYLPAELNKPCGR